MPIDTPLVGETWENREIEGDSVQASVIAVDLLMVTVVNRLGRALSTPASTFRRVWRFVEPPATQACSRSGCFSQVVGRLPSATHGNLAWVCTQHLQAARPARVLLPADIGSEGPPIPQMEVCLSCKAARAEVGFDLRLSDEVDESGRSMTVSTCRGCKAQWVLILGTGAMDNYMTMAELLGDAATLLDGSVANIRAFVDGVALRALRRSVGSSAWSARQSVLGTPVEEKSEVEIGGTNRIVVLGLSVDRPDVAPTPPTKDSDTDPQPNEVWWNVQSKEAVCVTRSQTIENGTKMIRYRGDTTNGEINLDQFLSQFAKMDTLLHVEPTQEWQHRKTGAYFTIIKVDYDKRVIEGTLPTGRVVTESFKAMLQDYEKVNRRSAYDRLLDDDVV